MRISAGHNFLLFRRITSNNSAGARAGKIGRSGEKLASEDRRSTHLLRVGLPTGDGAR